MKKTKLMRCVVTGILSLAILTAQMPVWNGPSEVKAEESALEEFVIEDGVLTKYNGSDINIVIPDGVKAIGSQAFQFPSYSSFTIEIPESVNEIANNAICATTGNFYYGTRVIKGKFGSIAEEYAKESSYFTFAGKDGDLFYIKGDNSVSVYSADSNVTVVTVPDNLDGMPVTVIHSNCFSACKNLQEIIFECEGATSERYSFRYLELKFENCEMLRKITFKKSNHFTDINLAGTENIRIEGMQLSGAEKLNLSNSKQFDLSSLKDVDTLTELNLSNSDISDILPLSDMNNLQILNISGTQISDITPLEKLENLSSVSINNTMISESYMESVMKPLYCIKGERIKDDSINNYMKIPISFDSYAIELPADVDTEIELSQYGWLDLKAKETCEQINCHIIATLDDNSYSIPWTIEIKQIDNDPPLVTESNKDLHIKNSDNLTAVLQDADGKIWTVQKDSQNYEFNEIENIKQYEVVNIYRTDTGTIESWFDRVELILDKQDTLYVNGKKKAVNVVKFDALHALTNSGDLICHYDDTAEVVTDVAAYATTSAPYAMKTGKGFDPDEVGNTYLYSDNETVNFSGMIILKKDGALYYSDSYKNMTEDMEQIATGVQEVYDNNLGWLTETGEYYVYDKYSTPKLMLTQVTKVLAPGIAVRADGTTWAGGTSPIQLFNTEIEQVVSKESNPDTYHISGSDYLYMDTEHSIWRVSVEEKTNETTGEIYYETMPVKLCENSLGLEQNLFKTNLNMRINGYRDTEGQPYICYGNYADGLMLNKDNADCFLDGDGNLYHNGILTLTKVKEYHEMDSGILTIREDNTVWFFYTDGQKDTDERLVQLNATNQSGITKGDINEDRKITLDDAWLALKIVLKVIENPTASQLEAGNVIGKDNEIRLDDVQAILKRALKIPVVFDSEK